MVGHETSESLDIRPAELIVVVREDECLKCPDHGTVISAPPPARLVPKGKLSDTLIIEAVADKSNEEKVKHLYDNNVAEALIIEMAKVDQGVIDAVKKAMASFCRPRLNGALRRITRRMTAPASPAAVTGSIVSVSNRFSRCRIISRV